MKAGLVKHEQTLHQWRKYNCDLCDYITENKNMLSIHQKPRMQVPNSIVIFVVVKFALKANLGMPNKTVHKEIKF